MIKTTDIRNRRFRKTLRGYDPVEVNYFLEMLADEFAVMEEKLAKFEALFAEFDQTRQGRDKIIQEAQGRAARIILDAESISSDVLSAAEHQKKQLQNGFDRLNIEREKLIHTLRQALKAQDELLKWLEDPEDWSIMEGKTDAQTPNDI